MSTISIDKFNKSYEDQKLKNCNFIKMVLMLIVVFYHSSLYWADISWFIGKPVFKSYVLKYFSLWLNSFHIYTFTLVSGYIYYYLRYEKNKYIDKRKFIYKKFKRLIVPAISVMLVWVCPVGVYYFNLSYKDAFFKYFLAVSPNQLWFLWMLFDIFVLVAFLSNLLKSNTSLAFCISIFLFIIGVAGGKVSADYFCYLTSLRFFIFFTIGFKIRQFSFDINRINILLILLIINIFLFSMYYSIEPQNIIIKMSRITIGLCTNIIGAILAFFILQYVANLLDWNENIIIKQLIDKSMLIYLFHQQIVYFLINKFNGALFPFAHSCLNFLSSLIISLLISYILIKLPFIRALIGYQGCE